MRPPSHPISGEREVNQDSAMRPLSLTAALAPLVVMLIAFVAGSTILGSGTELLVVTMLSAASVAGFVAVRHGASWSEIESSTGKKLAGVLPAILILLAIGLLIGSWVLSGTIPAMIYWGIRMVNPQYLVLTSFLVAATMSLVTGTSWGSAGTIGVALMGTAAAIGAPLAVTAGAILSGAYFGDKLSPLSDSTNICAIGAGADLYAHIRHMLYTTLPSFGLALAVYWFVGGSAPKQPLPTSATVLVDDINTVYSLSPWVFLPLLVVLAGLIKRYPAVLTIAAGSVVALVIGVWVQGFSFYDAIIVAVNGFSSDMTTSVGVNPETLSEPFLRLLNRGGLAPMVSILLVIISAFLLAGALDVSGALELLLQKLLSGVQSVFGLILATMTAGLGLVSLTSHGGVSALIVGELFQGAYRERGLAPENLSRSLEDSITIVDPLLPWTVSALYMSTTLGVPTLDYLPWAVFCYCGPIFSVLYAATYRRFGFGIRLAKSSALRD